MLPTRVIPILVALLLSALSLQVIGFMKEKSVTADEMIFIKTGYQYLRTGKLPMDDVNPPLTMAICALPLLFLNLDLEPESATGVEEFEFGFNFLFYNQNPDQILFWSRLPTLFLSLMLGFLVFYWSKELYGPWAGVLALFFYSFSPNILSMSGLATPDLGSTFFIVLTLYFFWKFSKNPGFGLLTLTCVLLGLAFCAKHTSIMLIPTMIIILAFLIWKKGVGQPDSPNQPRFFQYREGKQKKFWGMSLIIFLMTILLTINMVYKFQGTGTPLRDLPLVKKEVFTNHPLFSKILNPYTEWIPSPLPYPFLRSLGSTLSRTSVTNEFPSFLNGRFSTEGWWHYFLVAFLIKTPIPFLLCILYFLFCFYEKQVFSRNELFLAIPAILIFLLASKSNTQIGIRHIFLVYPLLFILVSNIINTEMIKRTPVLISGVILLFWQVFSSATVSPHYLAYFNEFVGGPKNGYHYLIDSNLDWGQDVKGLVDFLDRKDIDKIKFGHWIGLDPRYSGRIEELGCEPTNDWVAIQVNSLQGLTEQMGIIEQGCYSWLRKLQPHERIGYSIFVYHFP